MSAPSRQEILKLYKNLLRYGEQLKFTDKQYFSRRIRDEFKANKDLTDEAEIEGNYITFKKDGGIMLGNIRLNVLIFNLRWYGSIKKHIDYSRAPTLNEADLEEQQVRGSGPGGQKINKTSSAVFLKHIPTGIFVKCQETRYLEQNRKIARSLLLTKLDKHINGEMSIEAQSKRLQEKKRHANETRKEKLRQLKEKWKEQENID